MIGIEIRALAPAIGSAFVAAGLLSAVLFPALALSLLRTHAPLPRIEQPLTVA